MGLGQPADLELAAAGAGEDGGEQGGRRRSVGGAERGHALGLPEGIAASVGVVDEPRARAPADQEHEVGRSPEAADLPVDRGAEFHVGRTALAQVPVEREPPASDDPRAATVGRGVRPARA